jgi:hypothetical protein
LKSSWSCIVFLTFIMLSELTLAHWKLNGRVLKSSSWVVVEINFDLVFIEDFNFDFENPDFDFWIFSSSLICQLAFIIDSDSADWELSNGMLRSLRCKVVDVGSLRKLFLKFLILLWRLSPRPLGPFSCPVGDLACLDSYLFLSVV